MNVRGREKKNERQRKRERRKERKLSRAERRESGGERENVSVCGC